jgi:hypothetical protein
VCKLRATRRWKALDEGYNFTSDLILIGGLHNKLSSRKITRIPTETKSHLDEGANERSRVFYMGEGGGFP